MTVLIREGSVSKDLHALAEVLDDEILGLHGASAPTTAIRSTSPRRAISTGSSARRSRAARRCTMSIALATWSAASAFGLRDRGLVAPGRRADLVLVDDLERCSVRAVIAAGRLVSEELFAARPHMCRRSACGSGEGAARWTAASFRAPAATTRRRR